MLIKIRYNLNENCERYEIFYYPLLIFLIRILFREI